MAGEKDQNVDEFISTHEDINVQEIMDSIKKKIEEKKKSGLLKDSEIEEIEQMELLPLPDFQEVPGELQSS